MNASEQLVAGMRVSDLADLSGVSVGDIVTLISPRGLDVASAIAMENSEPPLPAESSPEAHPQRGPAVETRTKAGREAFDAAILATLHDALEGDMSSRQIRETIGGSVAAVRTRCNKLIESGCVAFKGRASGTRYRLLAKGRRRAEP